MRKPWAVGGVLLIRPRSLEVYGHLIFLGHGQTTLVTDERIAA